MVSKFAPIFILLTMVRHEGSQAGSRAGMPAEKPKLSLWQFK